MLLGYKYLLLSPLGIISHFFLFVSFLFRVSFSCSLLFNNGGKERHQARTLSLRRGKFCSQRRQDSSAGTVWNSITSRIPVGGVLSPPSLTGVWQGGPFGKAPVIDLSSSLDEEDFFADTSRDFEFTQRLYGKLNRDLLRPPDDGKVIILSDSNGEKEEAREEKPTDAEDVAVSTAVNPVSTASADDIGTPTERSSTPAASPAVANDDPGVAQNDSSDGLAPGPKMEEGVGGGDEAGAP
jgi:hypothetical protein